MTSNIDKFYAYKIPLIGHWSEKSPFHLELNVYVARATSYGAVELIILSCKENIDVRDALYKKMRDIQNLNKSKDDKYGTIVRHCCIRSTYIIGERNFISVHNIRKLAGKTIKITIDDIGYKQFTIGSKYCVGGKYDRNFFPKLRISDIKLLEIKNKKDILRNIPFRSISARKRRFKEFRIDLKVIYNVNSKLNWLRKNYLGKEYEHKFEYLGLKYIAPKKEQTEELMKCMKKKDTEWFKKAIDILYTHKYYCNSMNCYACNAVYDITKGKLDDLSNDINNIISSLIDETFINDLD